MKVRFTRYYSSWEKEVGGVRYISNVFSSHSEEYNEEKYFVFDLNKMNMKIASIMATKEVPMLVRNEEIYIETSSVPYLKTFQIS